MKKSNLNDFACGMVDGAKQAGLSSSENSDVL